MPYTKVGPFTNNAPPYLNAANLDQIEGGIATAQTSAENAQARADQAYALGSGTASGVAGTVLLDTFSGATDDDKLDAALAYVQTQTQYPTILCGGRTYTFTRSHTSFDGMRISGTPMVGWIGSERSGGKTVPTKWVFNGGNGSSSLFVSTTTVYYVYIGNLALTSSNGNSQFLHHPIAAGTSFCWTLDNLSFVGFKYVLGNPTNPWSATCCTTTGDWTIIAGSGTPISIQGSDNNFWIEGRCNIGPDTNANMTGQFLMQLTSLGKTNIGGMYFTADGGARAIKVSGSTSFGPGLYITGMRIEGRNPTDPCNGALIKIDSGAVMFRDTWIAYAMANPGAFTDTTDTGIVMVTGGDAIFDGVTYDRASGVGESTPLFRVTGGALEARKVRTNARGGSWSGKPVASQSGSQITADSSVTLVTA